MSKSKHTPGPWTTSRKDLDSYVCNSRGKYEHVVYVYRKNQPRIGILAGKLNNARVEADLIAKAPELLKACKKFLHRAVNTNMKGTEIVHATHNDMQKIISRINRGLSENKKEKL